MKIFNSDTVREIDEYTIKHEPIEDIDLMERAATRLKDWFVRKHRINREVVVFAGPGNNGGDALALARMLAVRQYKVLCCLAFNPVKCSPSCAKNLARLKELEEKRIVSIRQVSAVEELPVLSDQEVVIDGLFGSGLTRVVDGFFREVIAHINESPSEVIAVDIPSGLFGEDNAANEDGGIIRANYTLTFQFPFLSFFFAENEQYTGNWKVMDIGLHPEIIRQKAAMYSVLTREEVKTMLPGRKRFDHKGVYGHALAIAGSRGMMGAAILTGEAALRSGAGLVTLHVPAVGYQVVQTAFPEAIVSVDGEVDVIGHVPDFSAYDAVALGPGIGRKQKTADAVKRILGTSRIPMVIDADALNIISENQDFLELLPRGTILTPHPGEFDRLAGPSASGWERHLRQIEMSGKYEIIIVLKGAFTGISFPDGSYRFNPTGNPGMATGGSGDVLTGIILSLLARGLPPEEAAMAGVFLHGAAGDLAAGKTGQESLIAGDLIRNLGDAFKKVKADPFLHEGRTGAVFQ